MKLAIIIKSFCETTFSFAEAWASAGNEIDVFYISNKSQILKEPGFETDIIDVPIGEYRELHGNDCKGASQMLRYSGVRLYFYRIPDSWGNFRVNPIKGIVDRLASLWYVSRLGKEVARNNYDLIEVIFPSVQLNILLSILSPNNTLVSFHEIVTNKNKTDIGKRDIHNSLKVAIRKRFNVRFYSTEMKDRVIELYPKSEPLLHVIPFGQFTMYRDYENLSPSIISSLPKDYILYFGYIYQYKGLDVLWSATELLNSNNKSIPVVIAGNGYVPVLDKMKTSGQYTVINRFIKNAEIVQLIKNCKAVICPYIGCSQSGIPMTVYPYGKPVIASSVGDFQEVILHNLTGIIVPQNNPSALANAISMIFCDDSRYREMKTNIKNFDILCNEHSWDAIISKYKYTISNIISRQHRLSI